MILEHSNYYYFYIIALILTLSLDSSTIPAGSLMTSDASILGWAIVSDN